MRGKKKEGEETFIISALVLASLEMLLLDITETGARNCTCICSEVVSYTHVHGKVGKWASIRVCLGIYIVFTSGQKGML